MLCQDLVAVPTELIPTEGQLPAIIAASGRKTRDRIEHFLRAATPLISSSDYRWRVETWS
jgi:hypothetical protein